MEKVYSEKREVFSRVGCIFMGEQVLWSLHKSFVAIEIVSGLCVCVPERVSSWWGEQERRGWSIKVDVLRRLDESFILS